MLGVVLGTELGVERGASEDGAEAGGDVGPEVGAAGVAARGLGVVAVAFVRLELKNRVVPSNSRRV